MNEYIALIFFSIIIGCLVLCIGLLAFFLGNGEKSPEKLSAYECGFNPFESSRQTFEVKFYLLAMLFILFDVEIALLLPFVVVFSIISQLGFINCVIFLLILAIGFIYESQIGALTWYELP